MKTKFNLSEIMSNAHKLFKTQKGTVKSFADCLRRVWAMAKAYARSGKASSDYGVSIVVTNPVPAMSMDDAIAADYAQKFDRYGRRRYFED